MLREHMDELHRISQILIERETIDRDQFERLLAGEDEATVFPDAGDAAGGARSRTRSRSASASRARARSRFPARRCSLRRIPRRASGVDAAPGWLVRR